MTAASRQVLFSFVLIGACAVATTVMPLLLKALQGKGDSVVHVCWE